MQQTNTTTNAARETGQFTFWQLIEKLGCHVEPYPGGGVQVFIGRAEIAQPELYRELWNLSDAHVVGTLSGPSLHVMPTTNASAATSAQDAENIEDAGPEGTRIANKLRDEEEARLDAQYGSEND